MLLYSIFLNQIIQLSTFYMIKSITKMKRKKSGRYAKAVGLTISVLDKKIAFEYWSRCRAWLRKLFAQSG